MSWLLPRQCGVGGNVRDAWVGDPVADLDRIRLGRALDPCLVATTGVIPVVKRVGVRVASAGGG